MVILFHLTNGATEMCYEYVLRDLNHFNAPLELCKSNSQMTEELLAMIN